MLLVKSQQTFLELRQREEIARLAAACTAGVLWMRADFRFLQLFFGLERLAALAIPAFVCSLVDIAVVVDLLDELPAARVVARLAGLDEVVVADVQGVPDLAGTAGPCRRSRP